MIEGIAAAICWGVADFGAAMLSRRLRAIPTVFLVQAIGAIGAVAIWAALRPGWDVPGTEMLLLVVNGLLAGVAYVLLYQALSIGPVALVAPIAATYAVYVVGLSVVVIGEVLTGAMLSAIGVTIAGVVLASADPRRLRGGIERGATGVRLAFAVAFIFGFATFVMGRASQEIGSFTAVMLGRTFTALCIGAVLARSPHGLAHVDRRGWLGVTGLAALDLAGILLYARGTEVGLVSIVTAASATFPLISIIGGVALLGERPARTQIVGALVVVSGLVALGAVS